ncbi:MAG: rRNA maturation RNase YbeY [Paracoccaceae bacterium]
MEAVVEDARWNDVQIASLADRAVKAALAAAGLEPSGYAVALLACDDDRIASLNTEFRHVEGATNVLSWPAFRLSAATPGGLPSPPPQCGPQVGLGDIAIAYDTCLREAGERSVPLADHAFHLIVHGCLHLLGYDHAQDADATVMETLEVIALATEGIPNPY